jgi:hypothetical protein
VNQTISDMALALTWISDLSDIRLIKQELSCAGFEADDVDMYADCAAIVARVRRTLGAVHNQLVDIATTVNEL